MTFNARWAGHCAGCRDDIRPGDVVEYIEERLVHAGCVPGERERPLDPIRRPVCPECFTETAVNGACACP